jgi:hypothetical protein
LAYSSVAKIGGDPMETEGMLMLDSKKENQVSVWLLRYRCRYILEIALTPSCILGNAIGWLSNGNWLCG